MRNNKLYIQELTEWESRGFDTVEQYIEHLKENDLEYIADLVEQGYTSGISPSWSIEISAENDEEHTKEERAEYIAQLIRDGFTSGICPTWSLEIITWTYEDMDLE